MCRQKIPQKQESPILRGERTMQLLQGVYGPSNGTGSSEEILQELRRGRDPLPALFSRATFPEAGPRAAGEREKKDKKRRGKRGAQAGPARVLLRVVYGAMRKDEESEMLHRYKSERGTADGSRSPSRLYG
ncbi:hypothetical protein KM043_009570 [Ampulex compressa]|nr:hypothetical protein KM043_009570 [Ampulex compressa]